MNGDEAHSGKAPAAAREPAGDYLLGSGDAELARLAFQHRAWAEAAYALWERAGFRRGATLLDLGCGPGFATVDLAHLVGPEGRVIAVDTAPRFLDHLRRLAAAHGLGWIDVRRADAGELDLPSASLGGAYARWLFCFLPDPGRALAVVARALAPGARLAVTDYFNYRAFTLAPRSAAFDRVVEAVAAAWRREGGDLEIQGRLPGLCREHGLEPVDLRPVVRLARPGSPLWAWPETFFRGFLPALVDSGLLTSDDGERFWHDWNVRAADPAAYLSLPPMIDLVAERR